MRQSGKVTFSGRGMVKYAERGQHTAARWGWGLLCFLMAWVVLQGKVKAEELRSGVWGYAVSSGEATVTGYYGGESEIVIPDYLDGYPVTAIGSHVCEELDITSVTIPVSIESIGYRAFSDCKYLRTINFNAKYCKGRGDYIFENAGKFSDALTVVFGPAVTYIPGGLFGRSSDTYVHITSVVMPDSIQAIGGHAFENCFDLVDVAWGSGITEIGYMAFNDCFRLSKIVIPASVASIGDYAFQNCKQVTAIQFNARSCKIGRSVFYDAGKQSGSVAVTFGSGVLEIPGYIFCGDDLNNFMRITSVEIPSSCKTIGTRAFGNCYDLERVTVKGKSTVFPEHNSYYDAFSGCKTSLTFQCYRNSTAAGYAKAGGFRVSYLDPAVALSKCSVKLNTASYTYNGKERKPSATVKYGSKTLKKGTDYTISYSNNKAVGTAAATLKGAGSYEGTVKKTFKIVPKGTSISKLTGKTKGFEIQVKRQSTQTSGYQIRYSTKSSMSGTKTVTLSPGKSATKAAVYGLKAKKTYYVQVRTYKTVKGKKYYSAWSGKKKVRTK